MASRVDICNQALAAVGANRIESIDEDSVAARECALAFDGVVADLLERHEWGFASARVTLAVVPNARPDEWLYAYARPANAASLRRVIWPGRRCAAALGALRFIADGTTIYTNVEGALIDYVRSDVQPGEMTALFARAVAYELAVRIAMPLRKDRGIVGDMVRFSERARAEAMADDANRNPRIAPAYVSEVELAREGWFGPW